MKNKFCYPVRGARFIAIAVAIVAAVSSGKHAESEPANSFAIHDVTVFDGTRTQAHQDVIVRDGLIAQVGTRLKMPAGLPVIEGQGKTLMPGLIDAHVHTWGNAQREALRFGVTTELDMFTQPSILPAAKLQRTSLARTDQSDLWSAGILATVPGGHGTEYGFKIPTLTRAGEAEGFVADRVKEGSDYLKIVIEDGSAYGHPMPSLDAATVRALASSAHAHGLLSMAHVATQHDAQVAFDGGVSGLAHVFADRKLDAKADAAFLKQASEHFVVATLAVQDSLSGAGSAQALMKDARVSPYLSTDQRQALATAFPPAWQQPKFIANALHNIGVLHAAHVPVLAGTDAGNPGTTHGASLHAELALLVKAGLTPLEALQAATSAPAKAFSLKDRGRIAAGLRADLLLVDGDPTTDIEATRAINTVWKNGYAVDRGPRQEAQPQPVAAAAPQDTLIADFSASSAARTGLGFSVTTDQLAGGKSSATLYWVADGGFVRVQGLVDAGLPYAWAGAMWMVGDKPMAPVDYSARKTLVFKVRGEARQGLAMIFSGPASNGRPAMLPFQITPQWTEVRLPLASFQGADLAQLRGLAITVGLPAGAFGFDLDDVSIQ